MSTVTTFLNLVKPAPLEPFSRSTYNNNLDLVDNWVKDKGEKQAKGVLSSGLLKDDTNSIGLGGSSVLVNAVQVSFEAGRTYKVTFRTDVICVATNLSLIAEAYKDTVGTGITGAAIDQANFFFTAPVSGNRSTQIGEWFFKATTTETIFIKIVMARATGTDTYDVSRRRILVEDMGANY